MILSQRNKPWFLNPNYYIVTQYEKVIIRIKRFHELVHVLVQILCTYSIWMKFPSTMSFLCDLLCCKIIFLFYHLFSTTWIPLNIFLAFVSGLFCKSLLPVRIIWMFYGCASVKSFILFSFLKRRDHLNV